MIRNHGLRGSLALQVSPHFRSCVARGLNPGGQGTRHRTDLDVTPLLRGNGQVCPASPRALTATRTPPENRSGRTFAARPSDFT